MSRVAITTGMMFGLQTGVDVALVEARGGGWWRCLVVASTHPSYPVGGYDLSIHERELASGTLLEVRPRDEQPELVTREMAMAALGFTQ